MQSKSFPDTQRGLTLIEGCITLAIVSILAGTAAPSFIGFTTKRALDGSAGEMATDLYLARSEAVSKQQGVRVSFYAVSTGACMVVHTGAVADCSCDNAGLAQCTDGATLIKGSFFSSSRGISLAANVASIRFDPTHGMASPAGTVRVTASNGMAVHHVVSTMGRVRTCLPGGSAKGYKSC